METKINRIAILTSGGDAPGMNAAVRAVVRTARNHDIKCLGIRRGFNGLMNGDMIELGSNSVNGLIVKGGTMLYTARSPEFITEEGQKKAADTCRYLGIDGVVCIGGDGTFRGARDLTAQGVSTVCIPATIDNDIACTHYSIGFDTACNTALDAVDKLRDTMQSHERISVVQVMGRNAGHLAVYVGISCGAIAVLVPERDVGIETEIAERIREARIRGRTHFIVIVAEGAGDVNEICERIEKCTGMDARVTILGHVQRGGSPTARDRVAATRMGRYAVECLREGKSNRVVVMRSGDMSDFDITEALSMKKDLQQIMYDTCTEMSTHS